MSKKQEEMIAVTIVAILVLFLSGVLFLGKKEEYSYSERRKLKEFPKASQELLEEGKFGKEFEEYTLDHFPFREKFRGLKTIVSKDIFQKKDQNGIYQYQGYLVKMEYPLNQEILDYGSKKLKNIYDKFLKEKNCKCYLSIVPDKNFFLAKEAGMLSLDYNTLFQSFTQSLSFAKYIDITKLLSIEDYYKTDTHWRQEKITDVAKYLGQQMGADVKTEYEKVEWTQPFFGVYKGQWSLPVKGEPLYYLTNDVLDNCIVTCIEGKKNVVTDIYDEKKAKGNDMYDLFLSGANAIQIIENRNTSTPKELIVFRDSFASSLVPLLVEGYSKIILVDIRYVQSAILERYIDFEDQDILFLYSTLVLNQSHSFK